jgi:hypothetical protein
MEELHLNLLLQKHLQPIIVTGGLCGIWLFCFIKIFYCIFGFALDSSPGIYRTVVSYWCYGLSHDVLVVDRDLIRPNPELFGLGKIMRLFGHNFVYLCKIILALLLIMNQYKPVFL